MATIRKRPPRAKPLRPNRAPDAAPKPPAQAAEAPARASAPPPEAPDTPDTPEERLPPRPSPVAQLEERLAEPEEGAFLHGLEPRVYYPTLIEQVTLAGRRVLEVVSEYDSPSLFTEYEQLEFEVSWVRERAAFSMGYEHGAADGRVEVFRTSAPGLREPARQLADQARALVVNKGLSVNEATALLLETAWALVLARPAPTLGA
ncbi:MAG: hypothetical protein MUF34_37980 [Polyangiaceae bacterium]|jgi:hypothetical protein|nr:hypothetical protein [Polyangiaceae bacterium]